MEKKSKLLCRDENENGFSDFLKSFSSFFWFLDLNGCGNRKNENDNGKNNRKRKWKW
jgi:hypothetical protein